MSRTRKHIYLSGFMGAGKSRIGRTMQERTHFPFHDIDNVIEEKIGKSVANIFSEDGEEFFRELEKRTIQELAQNEQISIIALGGGAVMSAESREIMFQTGFIIYLKSSPEAIYERVKHKTHRPLLRVDDADNSKEKILIRIKTLMAQRSAYYEQADLVIERDGMDAEEVAGQIIDFLLQK